MHWWYLMHEQGSDFLFSFLFFGAAFEDEGNEASKVSRATVVEWQVESRLTGATCKFEYILGSRSAKKPECQRANSSGWMLLVETYQDYGMVLGRSCR